MNGYAIYRAGRDREATLRRDQEFCSGHTCAKPRRRNEGATEPAVLGVLQDWEPVGPGGAEVGALGVRRKVRGCLQLLVISDVG